MVFLPYEREREPGVVDDGRSAARIAPFARANYYREAVTRLQSLWSRIRRETGHAKGEGRIFCNSRYPEKQMAWLCGLGLLGKNSLILTPEYGSLGIIAGIFLPFALEGDGPIEGAPYESCRSCRACGTACPGEAIRPAGGIDKKLCYQFLSTEHRVLPVPVMERWGNILYGCQICQEVCPENGQAPEGHGVGRGRLGEGLDPLEILEWGDEELKARLKGSVLGARWIGASVLKRNALLCLAGRRDESARKVLERYAAEDDHILAETAAWVLERIKRGGA